MKAPASSGPDHAGAFSFLRSACTMGGLPLRSRTFNSGRPAMTLLSNLDLVTDPAAHRVVKDETVAVEFAAAAGELMSLEGPNRYAPGDAMITGATGDRWVVSRERFDAKYVAPNRASLTASRARIATGPSSCSRSRCTKRFRSRARKRRRCAARRRRRLGHAIRAGRLRRRAGRPLREGLQAHRLSRIRLSREVLAHLDPTVRGTASPFAYASSSEPSVASTYARSTA